MFWNTPVVKRYQSLDLFADSMDNMLVDVYTRLDTIKKEMEAMQPKAQREDGDKVTITFSGPNVKTMITAPANQIKSVCDAFGLKIAQKHSSPEDK